MTHVNWSVPCIVPLVEERALAQVALRCVSKTYPGGVEALAAVDLEVGDGSLFVVVGPSGSGKSTLLRLIAGLETPDSGTVWIGDRRVDRLPPRDRDVAMVFQNPALYPHLTVFDNLAFGLRARRTPRQEIQTRVADVAERLGLGDVLRRVPRTLSGGQRQRVALGRAIVRQPRVFLLDEPFSSLDAPLRASMRADLIDLHRRVGTTTILVTHDQAEAMALGDRIAVMDRGRIIQSGTPTDVYDRPATRFVAEFVGHPPINVLPCVVERVGDSLRIRVEGVPEGQCWTVPLGSSWTSALEQRGAGRFDLGLRPEQISAPGWNVLREACQSSSLLEARAELQRLERMGHETLATLTLGPHRLNVRLPAHALAKVGDRLEILLDPDHSVWFDAETGSALR